MAMWYNVFVMVYFLRLAMLNHVTINESEVITIINYDVPLNNRGLNANLRAKPVPDQTMLDNGFRWVNDERWCYYEDLGYNVSLNITVSTEGLSIDVLDDNFCQPYDYQAILRKNPESKVALEIHRKVQAIMKHMGCLLYTSPSPRDRG